MLSDRPAILVLNEDERAEIRSTVKSLADERDDLKRRLERAEAALHAARILIDRLKGERRAARRP